ncbi:MFS transporter [Saccharopolyspora indica]|uniref:MFS transporter n=1 Tax=Saccharopolyspora indica TaxID=1229659 RepID=UPI0022EB7798|nr:MFS transporter [Saccharopolyspora indica]MDA3646313.1 MFS transporter [Saccharopolyspora indica]
MPVRLSALTLSAFAIGVSEFVLVGLLPAMADATNVSLGTAGLLVTAYALAITVFSPIATSALSRFDARWVLVGLMVLFTAGNIAVALAPTFPVLLLGRIAAGTAHGTVFAIGAPVAASLVPADRASRAISMMFLGLTAAMVLGVPLGTVLGTHLGWRATFGAVAALGAAGTLAVLALIPSTVDDDRTDLRSQLRLLRLRPLLLTYVVTGLGFGASFAVFTYLEPLLTEHAGYSTAGVTWLLVLFGAATVAGNLLGGRMADSAGTVRTIRVALIGLCASLTALLLTGSNQVAVAVNLAVWGVFAFLISPAVQTHAVRVAEQHSPSAAKLASGLNIAAFNAGISAASFLGGRVIETWDVTATPWIGTSLTLLALAATVGITVGGQRGTKRTSRHDQCQDVRTPRRRGCRPELHPYPAPSQPPQP